MKTSIDKNFTTVNNVPMVKRAMKEFAARYTDGDIVRAIADRYPDSGIDPTANVISLSAEGFASGMAMSDDDVYITIDAVVIGWEAVSVIRAYTTLALDFRTGCGFVTRYERKERKELESD